ncbi:MAG: amino acid ABC transporter substrate-binding protein [Oscillospiraceae bacterium]|nr:amino acid ABC transporter substrate-binding protein [Oscillospiraceae bacterium]MBQ3879740.1 amino acid ABC transporter substrate-binding protein [Oscillospiraceae bacterium]
MKKFICLLLAVLMLAACLSACSGDGKKTVDTVKKAGQLVMATSPDFPPFEELQSDGTVAGIEIDVMNIICEKLGVKLKIEQMDFDSVLPGVQAGKYDVGVSGISVTENRKKNTLFTDPYCLAAQAIVVTADSPIASKADLTGKKISVQTGTTAEEFCMAEGYDVNSYAANSDAELALVTGKVDAWVIDDLTAAEMVEIYNAENEDQLVILSDAMTTEPYAFAFAFGSEELVAEINKIVNGLVADGTIASIFEKYNAPYTSPANK